MRVVPSGSPRSSSFPSTSDVQQQRNNSVELERKLNGFVKEKGFDILPMRGDGNCMFRAIAHHIYGDAEMHDQIRMLTLNYMVTERDYYSQYVTEDFGEYITRKRQIGCFGNSLELQAISELFNRPVEVYSNGEEPLNIFNSEFVGNTPLRVSYHDRNHYNAVIDPRNPTVGVGLGLPSFQPINTEEQLIERTEEKSVDMMVDQAKQQSELELAEQDIIQSMCQEDEYKQTQERIEQSIIQESRAQYWKTLFPPQ